MPLKERIFKFYKDIVKNNYWKDRHLIEQEHSKQHSKLIIYKHPVYRDRKFKYLNYFRAYIKFNYRISLKL